MHLSLEPLLHAVPSLTLGFKISYSLLLFEHTNEHTCSEKDTVLENCCLYVTGFDSFPEQVLLYLLAQRHYFNLFYEAESSLRS
jgi:hypothetical protein